MSRLAGHELMKDRGTLKLCDRSTPWSKLIGADANLLEVAVNYST